MNRIGLVVLFSAVFCFIPGRTFSQDSCLECHGDPEFTYENDAGEEVSLFVDSTKFALSSHGDLECTDCHADAEEVAHPDEPLGKVDCGLCHEDEVAAYDSSVHGKARLAGLKDAPSCADCHTSHFILPSSDPQSSVHPLNLAATCAICHADPRIVKKYNIPIADPLKAYKNSVHGTAVLNEHNFKAATCTSCHGSHGIRALDDPTAPIFWKNVPQTCGECHPDIYDQYANSIHGKAVAHGVRDAPVCTDCHGEHGVRNVSDPKALVNPLRVSSATCERCHASEIITQKYGMSTVNVQTYQQSYHGLAVREGSVAAANCASCHGIHNILPSSDPRSTIYPANLEKTCGSCHPDVSAKVAEGPIHLTSSTLPGRIVRFVEKLYIWVIVVVIGGMVIHNGLDFYRKTKRVLKERDEE